MNYVIGSLMVGQALALVAGSSLLSLKRRSVSPLLLAFLGVIPLLIFLFFSTPFGGQSIDFAMGVVLTGPPRYDREGLHLVGFLVGAVSAVPAVWFAGRALGRTVGWTVGILMLEVLFARHVALEHRVEQLQLMADGLRRHAGELSFRVMPSPVPVLEDAGFVMEPVVTEGLEVPNSLQMASDGRLFIGEQKGRISILHPDAKAPVELTKILEVKGRVEAGLLTLLLHPNFEEEPWLYVYFTMGDLSENRVERLRIEGDAVKEREVVFTGIPGHRMHNGGALVFGDDGKLYVGTGTADHRSLSRLRDVPAGAQHPTNLYGKILRLEPDGQIPADNPIEGSPVYARGFRMPYRALKDPVSSLLLVTENGSAYHDEIDVIRARANYGHPRVRGFAGMAGFEDPLLDIHQTLGITGMLIYTGDTLPPRYKNDVFFCSYVTGLFYWTPLKRGADDRTPRDVVHALRPSSPDASCKLDLVEDDGDIIYSNETGIYRLSYDSTRTASAASNLTGVQLYEMYCQGCHQAHGEGGGSNPPLNKSEWVNGDPATMAKIVLFGLEGEIEVRGKKYNQKMLPLGQSLRDEELAKVLSYVRSAWDNRSAPIDAALVKKQRLTGSQIRLP